MISFGLLPIVSSKENKLRIITGSLDRKIQQIKCSLFVDESMLIAQYVVAMKGSDSLLDIEYFAFCLKSLFTYHLSFIEFES